MPQTEIGADFRKSAKLGSFSGGAIECELPAGQSSLQTFKGFTVGGALMVARLAAPAIVTASSLYISTFLTGVKFGSGYAVLAALASVLALLVLKPALETVDFESSRTRTIGMIVGAWLVALSLLLLLGYATKMSDYFSRRALFVWSILGGTALVAAHYSLQHLGRRLMSRSDMSRRSVIVGVNETSKKFARAVEQRPELGLRVQGFFEDRHRSRLGADFDGAVVGRLRETCRFVREQKIGVVFVALPIRHVQRVLDLLDDLHDTTTSIYLLPDVFVFDLIQSRVHTIGGLPAISLCETPFTGYQGLLKRALDMALAACALLVLSPLLAAVVIAIRLTSPGSIVFRQRRYGLDGREIVVYKFRTMNVSEDGENVIQAQRRDPRLTRLGAFLRRYSIDELPQLVNVLQGRMSLVGPRPHAIAHNEQYRKLIKGYMFRHKVLPGITGWAQVNGFRGRAELEDMHERVDHDLYYLRNWSTVLDIKILLLTILRLAKADNAS